ncbi:MAG: polysaccharide biosynthesis protein, partial [Candidatus Margulisiibacteriota bacterium]
PAAEYNPTECIKTNVNGAMNVIDAAIANNVKRVIALSTDKACNPINLYGATKLCSDKLFVAANVYSGYQATRFAVVRYGNVLGSRGSVIPFFKERKGSGVLPITDPQMTRFWITLDQAAHLVLFAMSHSQGGEVFVPKIPSMKIVDLAKAIAPECRHEIVGIRPGEKIHEVLISEDDAHNTLEYKEFYIVRPHGQYKNDELNRNGVGRPCPKGFNYISGNNKELLSVDELRQLVERIADDYTIEKSRWSAEGIPQ